MLKDIRFPSTFEYRSGTEYEPLSFFCDALTESNRLDLLLGYFSSTAIRVLSLGFASFLANNGSARIIINQFLSTKDKETIQKGMNSKEEDFDFNILNIVKIRKSLGDSGTHFFECLAWLIASKRLIIQAIMPREGFGISHFKSGIFCDGTSKIKFKGSCNFTYTGLIENLEELDVKPSWRFEENIFSEYEKYFEDIIQGKNDEIKLMESSAIIEVIQSFGDKDLEELLEDEKRLLDSNSIKKKYKSITHVILKAEDKIHNYQSSPRFPYASGPRRYQKEAYSNWVKNNSHGIFAMATGTGKTITSLNCLLNEYQKDNTYKAVIVVPTTVLLEQWKKECLKFNFKHIITVSSKENWNDNLAFFNTANKLTNTSFIVIVTYASFARPKFQSHFALIPKEAILIADEVHNLGSKGLLKILPKVHLERKIGLSATPHRKFDEEGNEAIETFFNDKSPYIVSYSMKQALDMKWLCQYTYYTHIVRLNEEELKEYVKISRQLLMYIDPKTHTYKKSTVVDMLLLTRKRIIHKATNKIDAFKNILKEEISRRKNLKYTLVYVPEGLESNFSETDFTIDTEEDISLINEYTKVVSATDDSIMVKQYTSKSKNRVEILKDYEEGKVHVLTSMKCLDEGVDVPRSELAIFCSSTGNPRQFIQRRGRVLRLHKGKILATIHDLVVVPEISVQESNYEMERNLVRKELERVVDFSNLAMNKMDTYDSLKDVLDYYNLNLNDL